VKVTQGDLILRALDRQFDDNPDAGLLALSSGRLPLLPHLLKVGFKLLKG
jgi:hypothetical protein